MAVHAQQDAENRTPQQIQRDQVLKDMQLEALGLDRYNDILTKDYRETQAAFVPAASIERLADVSGTKENKLALKATKQLNEWNSAWQTLAEDGTAMDLPDVNEGLGQTHRIKLQQDESLRYYAGEDSHRGGRRGRGGKSGGRGGGFVGSGSGRRVPKEHATPVTRTRAVKGRLEAPTEPFKLRQAAKKQRMALRGETAPQPPKAIIAKLSGGNIDVVASVKRQSIAYGGLLATPAAFMGSLKTRETTPAPSTVASKQQIEGATQGKVTIPTTKAAALKGNVDASQERATPNARMTTTKDQGSHDQTKTTGPSALVPKAQPNIPSIAEQHANQTTITRSTSSTTTMSVIKGSNMATSSKSVTTSETSHTMDLMDLDVGERSSAQPVIGFTHSRGKIEGDGDIKQLPVAPSIQGLLASFFTELLSTNRLDATQVDEFKTLLKSVEARSSPEPETTKTLKGPVLAPKEESRQGATSASQDVVPAPKQSRPDNPVRSLAKHMEAAREAVIGEHISKCRWSADPAKLVKGMQDLSLNDEAPATKTTAKPDIISYAKTTTTTTAKPDITSYAKTNPFGTAEATLKFDPGAAARAQYAGTPAPPIPGLTAIAGNTDAQGYAIRGAAGTQKDPAPFAVKHDVVAARAPSGGASILSGTAATPPLTIPPKTAAHVQANLQPLEDPRNQPATRKPSGPMLPAWMRDLKPAADPGHAARTQYGGSNVLAPVTNTQAPARRSKINDSGFIGMVERAKKGQDPFQKALQLGL
ncbi:hypothetical protein P7C71_g2177, partial [Lecanoromycetidae sp. Uapishka_2]